ncbi:MAG: DUF1003 domain-containing protein [Patescibacteria group bacterium]
MTRARKEKENKALPTLGQRTADRLTKLAGSWHFIIGLGILLFCWIIVNIVAFEFQWDPYPFILLNFILSAIAAIQGPIILMSQNRKSEIDSLRSEYDYRVDLKAEREIAKVQKELARLHKKIDQRILKNKGG